MIKFQDGELARLRSRTPLFDRRKRYEGEWNDFWPHQLVRIFRIDKFVGQARRIHIETLSGNYEATVAEDDLIELSPLEQLAEQAE